MASPDELTKNTEDWSTRTADSIDTVVTTIREKTVGPLVKITRAIVYGILLLAALSVVGVLFAIAGVRILDVYAFGNRVWISYFVIGGILLLFGLLLWSKRTKRPI